ncbi:MAG: hypothetical protein SW833_10330 [Cyanobacteriota bacterium]|nr:hypothetical protein [Cyanobacteriota bacterium]
MHDETMLDLKNEQMKESAIDLDSAQTLLELYLTPNSLKDEIDEFFKEIAALHSQSIHKTVEEMKTGTYKYLKAIDTPILYKGDLPKDINLYVEKLANLAEGIETCWDIFSPESRKFFAQLAYNFCQVRDNKFKGLRGLTIYLKLLLPSIKARENLYTKYKKSFLLIPKAVDRAVELREEKETSQLSEIAASLSKRAKEVLELRQKLLPHLKHLGRDREDQIQKNQAAMAWAKKRMREIEEKHGWGTAEK